MQAHAFAAFTFTGREDTGMFKSREDRVAYMLREEGISSGDAKRFAKSFLKAAPVRKLSGDFYLPGGIAEAARRDLENQEFLLAAINTALRLIPGTDSLGTSLKFEIQDSDLGVYVFSNIDFETINHKRAGMRPSLDPITVAYILTQILEARADLALASFYGGDFVSSEVTSAIVQLRYAEILQRRKLNDEQLGNFHQVTLPDYPSLRETIDSGQRTFKEFLALLDRAHRFKEWLKNAPVDEGLVRSYISEVSREGWIQKVPAKTARYLFTLALESHSPVVGTAAALADNFIVDKLLGGWRPNHFVEGRFGPFLSS